jgi:glycerol-3-phosphate O-acyltransferase
MPTSPVLPKAEPTAATYKAPNFFVEWMLRFLSPLFQFVKVDPNYAALLQSYLNRGRVVMVMRVKSGVDLLYFNWLHRELGLPAPTVSNSVNPIFYQSSRELVRTIWLHFVGFFLRRPPKNYLSRGQRMMQSLREGGLPMMFLVGTRKFIGGKVATDDPTPDLIALQKELDEPILLLPQLILWAKDPEKLEKGPLDVIFGERDYPGVIRKTVLLVRNHRRAFVKTGEPINLREFVAQTSEAERPEVTAKKLRRTLRVFLAREERVIRGPLLKPRWRLLKSILKERDVSDALKQIARDENVPYERIEKKALKYLEEIAADYSLSYIEALDIILNQVWKRLYDRFYIDEVGLERMREAAKSGPLILVPNHRSHMDYLILSYVFFNQDLMPPHIAAGVNLSFWPLGPIFRHSGAFFLRRSFRGNRLYASVFEAYVRRLIKEGYNMEFFIEGTRSRTGKMLPPKLGMLNMLFEALLQHPEIKEAWIVPISVDYERIVEESSYLKELQGGSKEKESFVGIIKASKHIRTNYGRVFLQFAEPISLRDYLNDTGVQSLAEGSEPVAVVDEDIEGSDEWARLSVAKKAIVEELGYKIVNEIRSVATITSAQIVSAALLVHHKRGIARESLIENINSLRDALEYRKARLSTDFSGVELDVTRTLELFKNQRFITELRIAGQTVYGVDEQRRLGLDYYKNGVLGALYPLGFVALAFRGKPHVKLEEMKSVYSFLTMLFENDLNLKFIEQDLNSMQAGLDYFLERKYLELDEQTGEYQVLRPHRLGLFQQLYMNFLESYYVVIVTVLAEAANGRIEQKALTPRAAEIGRLLYAKGDLGKNESTSRVNLDLAAKLLVHHGILEARSEAPEAKAKRKKISYYYLTEQGRPWLDETKRRLEQLLLA